MQSIQLQGNETLACIDIPAPRPGPGQVLIETRLSALCGSELKAYRGAGMEDGNSGHEAAGIIAELGAGVTHLQQGQRVGISAIAGCGQCPYCDRGQNTWCPDRVYHGSMHAERFLTSAQACHPLPDDLSWEAGVLISGDGFGVPYHTSTKLLNEPIERVAVFGLGPIGLGNTMMQTHLGRQVIAIDIAPYRLDLARQLGAAHTIQADNGQNVVAQVRALTHGLGPDVCLEAAGRPETAAQCFAAVRTGGTVVFNGEQGPLQLSPSDHFIRRDITALGSWYYHFGQFAAMLKLYRAGLAIDRLITHHFPFAQAAEAFRLMAAGKTGKVVLHYGTD
ncbi:MAG: zinc-binding dehydrogenase [Candidatus Latescibacteria bacterium]|nr:zinc-binding dehydrogenase [Candidatus Latescibacterota bacterium]